MSQHHMEFEGRKLHPMIAFGTLLARREELVREISEIEAQLTAIVERPHMKLNPAGRLNENGESAVHQLIEAGLTDAGIARILKLDPSTVNRQRHKNIGQFGLSKNARREAGASA